MSSRFGALTALAGTPVSGDLSASVVVDDAVVSAAAESLDAVVATATAGAVVVSVGLRPYRRTGGRARGPEVVWIHDLTDVRVGALA